MTRVDPNAVEAHTIGAKVTGLIGTGGQGQGQGHSANDTYIKLEVSWDVAEENVILEIINQYSQIPKKEPY